MNFKNYEELCEWADGVGTKIYYSENGDWYHKPKKYPCILACNTHYFRLESQLYYNRCIHFRRGKDLNVNLNGAKSIKYIPGVVKFTK